MGDIINLKRARKRKAREAEALGADANRLRFGRPTSERQLDEAREALESRRLDGHKRPE
ncbi:MAG: DUF4169 family protein [Phreatobacter sp.]|uniref:DUF4169 family protein n=1 Tax=Phreatobacter sp. TaxID=1966341 RepID=UPI002732DD6E|nr:DUF4169 family protein [Phreatobacter sp.]MDP2802973.1 DUF4169 family protein [Phreatobacter sp.]